MAVSIGLRRLFTTVKETPKTIEMQLKFADLVVDTKGLGAAVIGYQKPLIYEVKTELRRTGNLFMETWSNRSTGREGWAITSPADELFYLFWDEAIGYRIPGFQSVKWLFDYDRRDFKEVQQKKTAQANDTWGCIVPIEWFKGAVEFDFTELRDVVEHAWPRSAA